MTVLRSGSASDVGRVRSANEDRLLDSGALFAVADGMGGHAGGEVAAALAIDTLQRGFASEPTARGLVDAVRRANLAVWERSHRDAEVRGMGTTLTVAALVPAETGDRLVVANVGDSRAYRYAAGRLMQMTTDHSVAEELVARGELSETEAAVHPHRHILTRALGVAPEVDVDAWELWPAEGERFVLCSDGLTNELTEDRIATVLDELRDPQSAAEALVGLANEHGGSDNVTVVVLDVVVADPPPASNEPGSAGAVGTVARAAAAGAVTGAGAAAAEVVASTPAGPASGPPVPADPGVADPGVADPGVADPGVADPGVGGAEDQEVAEGPDTPPARGRGRRGGTGAGRGSRPAPGSPAPGLRDASGVASAVVGSGPPAASGLSAGTDGSSAGATPATEPFAAGSAGAPTSGSRAADRVTTVTSRTVTVARPAGIDTAMRQPRGADPTGGAIPEGQAEPDSPETMARHVATALTEVMGRRTPPRRELGAMYHRTPRRRLTFRVVLFVLLVAAVAAGAGAVVHAYAEDAWYVRFDGGRVAIYQGRPGGFFGFHPHVVRVTSLTAGDVLSFRVAQLRAGEPESTLQAADRFVRNLRSEFCAVQPAAPSCPSASGSTGSSGTGASTGSSSTGSGAGPPTSSGLPAVVPSGAGSPFASPYAAAGGPTMAKEV